MSLDSKIYASLFSNKQGVKRKRFTYLLKNIDIQNYLGLPYTLLFTWEFRYIE